MPTTIPAKILLLHRMIRLYPMHWLALALTLLLGKFDSWIHPLVHPPTIDAGKLLAHVLLLHAWYPIKSFAFSFNYVSWSLCVDILLVLLAPWLYCRLVKKSTPQIVRIATVVWAGSLVLCQIGVQMGMAPEWVFLWPPSHISEFIVGMGGGFLVCRHLPNLQQRARHLHRLAYLSTALMIGLTGIGVSWLHQNSLIFAPCYLTMILSVTVSDNWLTRLFCTKLFMYLGRISFGVYILQVPIAILILHSLHPWLGWPYRYSALLFIVVLTGVAALTYEVLERPVIALAKRQLSRHLIQPALANSASPGEPVAA